MQAGPHGYVAHGREEFMANIWMLSRVAGTFGGDRCVTSSVPQSVADKIATDLNAEFADMGLDIAVWVD